jgi:hypothetical protein
VNVRFAPLVTLNLPSSSISWRGWPVDPVTTSAPAVMAAFPTLIWACPAFVAANVTSIEKPRRIALRMLETPRGSRYGNVQF